MKPITDSDILVDGISKFLAEYLERPVLYMHYSILLDLESSMGDITTLAVSRLSSACSFMGCPIVVDPNMPKNQIIMVSTNCEYCGQKAGAAERCQKCSAPRTWYNASRFIKLILFVQDHPELK